MTPEEKLQKFVQDLYLTQFSRRIDDITDSDGQEEIAKAVVWVNTVLDEIEAETDNDGQPIDWSFARENDVNLGTISSANQTFELDDDINRLVVAEYRPLIIKQGDSTVSYWDVVDPNQLARIDNISSNQRVSVVGGSILFSRPLNDTEIGGTVVADVINYIPRVSNEENAVNVEALDMVKPYQLLLLGAAKNATLPDIVQGGLSPSFAQKYADLLTKVIAKNQASSVADNAVRDDYGHIGGIY